MLSEERERGVSSDALGAAAERPRDHLRVLPPAANWYCSQVCDWGYDARNARWLIVYGAKNGICIYEFSLDPPPAVQIKPQSPDAFEQALRRPLRTNFVALLPRGKKDGRVMALRCIRDAEGLLRVVCAGEEGAVQIWDPVSRTRVDQHRKHNGTEVTAVGARSDLDPNWIVAGDRNGVISLWQRDSSAVHTFSPLPRDAVFSMDISPFDKKLVAVGYRSGVVCVANVVEKSIQCRLDGHELEVQSAAWSTITGSPVQYLATASRDRSIKVWAFPRKTTDEEDGQEPYLAARLEIRKPQQASSHSQSTRLWLPLAWTYDVTDGCKYGLWTGSFEGNLQLYQWNGVPSGTVKPAVLVKNGHNRLIFGIASLRGSTSMCPGSGPSHSSLPSLMVTISLDRELRVWSEDLTSKTTGVLTCIERIPAQGGFAYTLDFNSTRKLLACGVGDQTIRIWNLFVKQGGSGYQTDLVWKGMQSKVTCVRWHPLQDHILAFGTEDGRVGLWDLRNKSAQRLKVKHVGEIHQLEWTVQSQDLASSDSATAFQEAMKALEEAQAQGKSLEDAMSEQKDREQHPSGGEVAISLWSCDRSGLLCRTDVDRDVSQHIRKDCSAFAWDSSSSMLSVGLSSGKVEIMISSDSTKSAKSHHGLAAHSSIFEHKECVTAVSWSNSDTLRGVFLASGAKSGEIIVCEGVGTASLTNRRFNQLPGYGEHVVAVFKSHSSAVTCLRWNPSSETCILASCGDDGAVKVWDIAKRALRSSFNLHANRVFSTAWITSTVLSSCGQDQSIRLWDYENHTSIDREEPLQHSLNARPANDNARSSVDPVPEPIALKPAPKARGKKSLKSETMFNKTLLDWIVPSYPSGGCLSGTSSDSRLRETVRLGTAAEIQRLEQDGKIDEAAQVYLLEGRIAEALRLLAHHGLLNTAWVSYAPMAGQDVWREVSLLFAEQLRNGSDYKSAALQYLAVSRVESAVECFIDGGMYSEAISVIVSRLGSSHPLFKTTMWQYAKKLEKKQKSDEAASVYLTIGSTEARGRAISVLVSSGRIEETKRAMDVWEEWFEDSFTASLDTAVDEGDGVMLPSSVFVSMCSIALTHYDFTLASRAITGLIHRASLPPNRSVVSPQNTLYMLSLSTISITSTLHDKHIADSSGDHIVLDHSTKKVSEANQFLRSLRTSVKEPWPHVLQSKPARSESTSRPADFWLHALAVCRTNGLWFEGSALGPDDVVEQLGDTAVFDFMLACITSSGAEASRLRSLITSGRLIVKLLAELMSGYLLSALEVLRSVLLALTSSHDDQLATLQLLFPGGMLDPASPPLFGELADEQPDTKALWVECCLIQSELVLRAVRNSIGAPVCNDNAADRLSAYLGEMIEPPSLAESSSARAHALHEEIQALSTATYRPSQEAIDPGSIEAVSEDTAMQGPQ